MRPEAHQFLPSLGFRDAVGTHTLETRRALAQAGIRGRVWAEEIGPELAKAAGPPDNPSGLSMRRKKPRRPRWTIRVAPCQ